MRGIFLFLSISAGVFGAIAPALPSNAIANAVQISPAGNIYVAGSYTLPGASSSHAFVAEMSPAMSVIWWTALAGSKNDVAVALALGPDGSIYVTGNTESTDFPTTPGAIQTVLPVFGALGAQFVVRLNPTGGVVYSTLVDGAFGTTAGFIAVDSSGHAFVTGTGVFPATPGSVAGAPIPSGNQSSYYIVELSAAGTEVVLAIQGFGGGPIAVDPQGYIYVASTFDGPVAPTTSGAFQSTAGMAGCFPVIGGDLPCAYQHIAKIDPTGTKLIFATYLNGTFGASPSGLAVDASGNVIVAGTTNSPNYPTTPGAYQPEFFANPEEQVVLIPYPPPSAGYVTKLNASGSGLVWSTFLAGSGATIPNSSNLLGGDSIEGMAIDASGNVLIAGLAYSLDFPGLWNVPVTSRPTPANASEFVTRLSPDGSTLSATQLVSGLNQSPSAFFPIAAQANGTAVVGGAKIASVSFLPGGRVVAITDSADAAKLVSVAPGQLLTLYGTDLALDTPAQPSNGFPTSFNGVTVTFNGIAAPILYTSGIQINLQVPYEISGQSQVTMQVTSQFASQPLSESYILAVVERQPSVFLSPAAYAGPIFGVAACNGQTIEGLQALALNADGTLNSCANPAAPGSTVTIFLNGLGVTSPAQATGAVSGSAEALTPSAVLASIDMSASVSSTASVPGSIDGVAQVRLTLSPTAVSSSVLLALEDAQGREFLVRGTGIAIWVGAASAPHRRPFLRR